MLCNRFAVANAIKEELGDDTVVKHRLALPFTVKSECDGVCSKTEVLPGYFLLPAPCAPAAVKKTAGYASEAAAKAGAVAA